MVQPIPKGYCTVTPSFVFKDARKAIEFYKKALNATVRHIMPGPNGKGVMHAEIQIGDSIMMLGEENPQFQCKSAETYRGSPVSFYLYVKDADATFKQAVAAGAKSIMDVQDTFWGDRMGTVTDPFGYSWSLATKTKDLTPQEMEKGAKEFCAQACTK